MYSIVSNEEKLNQLQNDCSMPEVLSDEKVFKRLRADVECLTGVETSKNTAGVQSVAH